MKRQTSLSYEYIIFQELIYEYDPSIERVIEKKIKRRLKYYNLGAYSQERVDYIRKLKRELSTEIHLIRDSQYFKKTESGYAEIADFNVEQMMKDYKPRYNQLSIRDLRDMMGWAVLMLYRR
jgi:hypothetical protein